MATLVLTVVGGAIGGPIGAAIGSLAGQAIDARLLRPARRDGPRLADLHVQTSSYGSAIPAIFGTMRVAGTVIWATDIKEQSQWSGGKSGGGTSYSYSVSLAVALSCRPVRSVGRIWAEGNLLRGAGGDFKTPLGAFRLHPGLPGQAVDSLIASDVGIAQAPAYRGFAYAVLEDLQLADFGNRIPSLTFEVEADDGPVGLSAMAAALCGQPVAWHGDAAEPETAGYAAEGRDALSALAPLLDIHDVMFSRDDPAGVVLAAGQAVAVTLAAEEEIVQADGRAGERMTLDRAPIETVPRQLGLRHYDPARDYQAGLQRADRAGPGARQDQIDLPAAMDGARVHLLATQHLHRQLLARQRLSISQGWPALCRRLGDIVRVGGQPGFWRVEAVEWADMVPRLTLSGARPAEWAVTDGVADSGAPSLARDRVQGPTRMLAVDLPPTDEPASAPRLWAMACGDDDGWRWANVMRVNPASGTAEPVGTIGRSTHGRVIQPPVATDSRRIDLAGDAIVELWNANAALFPVSDDLLLRGRNLCLMGRELIGFGRAEQIGPRRFRLSRLLRGRRGTEAAMAEHLPMEVFALLDGASPLALAIDPAERGAVLTLHALGTGDDAPAQADVLIEGRAMLPLSPVHGRCTRQPDGSRLIHWVRRSRQGWAWSDGADVPLGEESERYRVTITAGPGVILRAAETVTSQWSYAAADLAADMITAAGAPLSAFVSQIGTFGEGPAVTIAVAAQGSNQPGA